MSFTVYRSSAGSGKTYVLVKEYLKIILQEPADFRHILAITFTNKAANEMKGRVLEALRSLSCLPDRKEDGSEPDLPGQLMKETGLSRAEIIDRSGSVLKQILHHYADFSIGTIDSFFHRIIRTFAHDFALPVNFSVEVDSDELLATAVDLLMDRLGDDPDLTKLLENFVDTRMDEDKGWNIDEILAGFAKNLLDERAQKNIPRLRNITLQDFHRIVRLVQSRIRTFEKTILELAEPAHNLILQNGIPITSFAFGKNGIAGYFEKLAAGDLERIKPNSNIIRTIEENKWASAKATSTDKKGIGEMIPSLTETFNRIRQEYDTGYPAYRLLTLLSRSIYPLALLNEIGKILSAFKKQNNLIHISEFNVRIARLILGEPVPFIYERLGERYHHLLIDEFQDTSALQWQNFVPLLENALSQGFFNLVVGDGKQAIYRWRNGDAEQFTRLPYLADSGKDPIVREQERTLVDHFHEQRLNRNYRSLPEIVRFNNEFFTLLSGLLDPPENSVYLNHTQEADLSKTGGTIRIDFLSKEDGEKSFKDNNHMKILEIIRKNIADGYRLRDLSILCRTNQEASEIARYLTNQEVPVISSESLLLIHSSKVRFLTAMIRFIAEPGETLLLAEIFTFLFQQGMIRDIEFHDLMLKISGHSAQDNLLSKILSDNGIYLRIAFLQTLPIYDLCEELIRLFFVNGVSDPYLQFFLETLLKYTSKHPPGISDFLVWWNKRREKISVIIPEGLDAIRIMTIHKAKGLQFPVVIFPYANEALKLTQKYLWIDLEPDEVPGLPTAIASSGKEMEETRFASFRREEEKKSLLDMINLLYVVMTRPEERLYILTSQPAKTAGKMQSLPSFFCWFLKEKGIWSEDQPVYEIGEKNVCSSPGEKTESSAIRLGELITDDWRKKIYIRSKAPEIWSVEDPDQNRRYGNLLHTVLSGIRSADDLEKVLQDLKYQGMIDSSELEGVKEKINQVLNHPEIKTFFKPGLTLKVESEILLPDGSVVRPDRIITDGKQAVVIDYKSGKPSMKYREQMEIYEKHLQELGFQKIRKYLLYLEPDIRLEAC